MLRDKFAFDGIERIERRLLRVADEVGYVVLLDRSDYGREIRLGRLDLDPITTAPWHRNAAGEGAGPASLREQAHALCAWLRAQTAESLEAVEQRRFRVKVFSPKGYRMVFSSQFVGQRQVLEQEPELQAEASVEDRADAEPVCALPAVRPRRGLRVLAPHARPRPREGTAPRPILAPGTGRLRPHLSTRMLAVGGPRSGPPPRSCPPALPGRAPPRLAAA